jgi:hypothetical protein
VNQTGNGNSAEQGQGFESLGGFGSYISYSPSDWNDAEIDQDGVANTAQQYQIGAGGHSALTTQNGSTNSAVTHQSGNGHSSTIMQMGSGNTANVMQSN